MSNDIISHSSIDLQPLVSCRVCLKEKPAGSFYGGQVRMCGLVGECKSCTKDRVKRRSRANPKVQEYDRVRAKTKKRRDLAREITKRWRSNNPLGYKAHTAVSNAVRDGKLFKKPCEICGDNKVHAHHKDYSKPLDIVWLCPKCHHRLHSIFPEIEGVNKS